MVDAYKAFEKVVAVPKVSLYAKINGLEPKLSQALVQYSSEQLFLGVAEFTRHKFEIASRHGELVLAANFEEAKATIGY